MIIYKSTKMFEQCSEYPNENFSNIPDNDVIVIDETTANGKLIAESVIASYPNFDIVNGIVTVDTEAVAEAEAAQDLIPSGDEIAKAKRQIETIELLTTLGVI